MALSLCAGLSERVLAQTPPSTRYQLQALYLYNFAKYTQWPQEALGDSTAPFVLGILGQDPFGKDIEIIEGKSIKNRKLVVRYFTQVQEVGDCHVLFISPSKKNLLPEILKALENSSVLTVSEFEGFIEQQGMVNLTVENNRIVFEINRAAAERAKLKFDARLLQLAKSVRNNATERIQP